LTSQDEVDEVIEQLRDFSKQKARELRGQDRFNNFRLIRDLTHVGIEEQLKLFVAKDISQLFVFEDQDDSAFDACMWLILLLAWRKRIKRHD